MKITNLATQVRTPDRVNVSVDGVYRFSLTIAQVVDLGIKIGNDYSETEIAQFEEASTYGKVYARALEYCLVRPRSRQELADYLRRKTSARLVRRRSDGAVIARPGIAPAVSEAVMAALVAKGYCDDEAFARFWVEHRFVTKGISRRKLMAELSAKGVDRALAEQVVAESERSDESELDKIIAKKQARYPDRQKFMQYLARQGFSYDTITRALERLNEHV